MSLEDCKTIESEVARHVRNFAFPQEGSPHWLLWAAGTVARCRSLLRAMIELVEHAEDTVGVIARAHWETSAAGFYLLYARQSAVDELASDFRFHFDRLLPTLGATLPEFTPAVIRDAQPSPLSAYQLAQRLDGVTPQQSPLHGYPLASYRHLFAGESLFSSHGRVGALIRHIEGGADGKIRLRETAKSDSRPIREAAFVLAYLAIETLSHHEGEVDMTSLSAAAASIGVPVYIDAPG